MTILPEICSYYCLENLELFVTISSAIRKKSKTKTKMWAVKWLPTKTRTFLSVFPIDSSETSKIDCKFNFVIVLLLFPPTNWYSVQRFASFCIRTIENYFVPINCRYVLYSFFRVQTQPYGKYFALFSNQMVKSVLMCRMIVNLLR